VTTAAFLLQQAWVSRKKTQPRQYGARAVRVKFSPDANEARDPRTQSEHLLHVERVLTLLSDFGARIAILARYAERQQRCGAQEKRRSFLGPPTNDVA
jgi:hypothetical protein